MLKKIIIVICLLILALPVVAQSGKDLKIISETNKVALVIGNSDYQNGFSKLNSPRNDAPAVAAALKRLGFRLVGGKAHIDATFDEMEKLVESLTDELKNGGVGFFYFSGHGSQDNSRDNFLIPVDTSISFQSDLKHKSLKVEYVTDRMEETDNRLNILVLDACRNNPLPSGFKSGNKGLNTNKQPPTGIYIAFAARDGQVAADGDYNGFSLYTRELLKNIETPNERLEDIFIETRTAVKNETKNRQSPFDYGSIDGRFYFKYEGQGASAGSVSTNSNNTPNRTKEAEAFFDLGLKCATADYDCQISNYSKAINLNPKYAEAYYNRGIAFKNKQDYEAAIRDYGKATELDPKYAMAYYNRGNAYSDKGIYDAAIQDYTKAIEIDPNLAQAYSSRGDAYSNQEDYDAAILDYTKTIKLDPKSAWAYNNRGSAYASKKEYDSAILDYNKAIKINPKFAWAYFKRGSAYSNEEDYAAAILDYTKAIEIDPKFTEAYGSRGDTYSNIKDYDAAIMDYTKAIELNSKFAWAYNNRGSAYANKKDYNAAIQDYTKALKIDPKFASAYKNRAISYDKIGETAKAQADRKTAAELEKP